MQSIRGIGKFRLRQPTFLHRIAAGLKVLHDYFSAKQSSAVSNQFFLNERHFGRKLK